MSKPLSGRPRKAPAEGKTGAPSSSEDQSPLQPRLIEQFRAWAGIGIQSVGGGSSTLFLIRRDLGIRRRWITKNELAEDWAVARIAPGMSLIAYSALIGRRIGGSSGAFTALVGLLAPAAIITALMAAGYEAVHQSVAIKAAISGAGPVALGLSIGVVTALGRSLMRGGRLVWVDVGVVLTSFAIEWIVPNATLDLLVGGGVVGALVLGRPAAISSGDAEP